MLDIVDNAVGRKLALDLVGASAHAGALWIAALHHKALDDAVEGQSVIEALVHQIEEVLYGERCCLGIELHGDFAVILYVDFNGFGSAGVGLLVAVDRQCLGRVVGGGRRCSRSSCLLRLCGFGSADALDFIFGAAAGEHNAGQCEQQRNGNAKRFFG